MTIANNNYNNNTNNKKASYSFQIILLLGQKEVIVKPQLFAIVLRISFVQVTIIGSKMKQERFATVTVLSLLMKNFATVTHRERLPLAVIGSGDIQLLMFFGLHYIAVART